MSTTMFILRKDLQLRSGFVKRISLNYFAANAHL